MKKLIILRGPSGSGKSTIASHLQDEYTAPYHEADSYFERSWWHDSKQSKYMFDASKLGDAHAWCRLGVTKHMFEGVPTIIVSNTNMTHWEMQPYLDLASEYGYEVDIIRTPGPWDAQNLAKRNVHGVPLETLKKQVRKYQPHADEKEWTDLSVFQE
jgi:NEDD4-binding protein 2